MGVTRSILVCCLSLVCMTVLALQIKLNKFYLIPPTSAAIIFGAAVGGISWLLGINEEFRFSPEVFYIGLLPPIVYAAGLNLQRRDFFRNFASIMLFSVVGTLLSSSIYALGTFLLYRFGLIGKGNLASPTVDSILMGILTSAIDPVATLSVFGDLEVPTLLHNLVFGESLTNDAICIVLFRTASQFHSARFSGMTVPLLMGQFSLVSAGSIAIGISMGLTTSLVLRWAGFASTAARFVRSQSERLRNPGFDVAPYSMSVLFMSAYVCYLLAEMLSLSGIMSLFFMAVTSAHYGLKNVSQDAEMSLRKSFEAISFQSETFVFIYLGIQVATFHHVFDMGLLLSALPLALLARSLNIFPLANIANLWRTRRIDKRMQVMQWACGLRGAVAYALAINLPVPSRAIETTTLFMVLVTTVFLGAGTGPLVNSLGLSGKSLNNLDSGDSSGISASQRERLIKRAETLKAHEQRGRLHEKFRRAEEDFLKPLFGGKRPESIDDESSTFPAGNHTPTLGRHGRLTDVAHVLQQGAARRHNAEFAHEYEEAPEE